MLRVNELSKTFAGRKILSNVDYNFPENKRIALIGANGVGKTTFLNILCGLEEYDSGTISKPKKMVLGYLPQEPNHNPKETVTQECMTGNEEIYQLKLQLDAAIHKMETEFSNEVYEEYERLEGLYRQHDGYSYEAKANSILAGLGFSNEQCSSDPKQLSGGWKMRLELAKILIQSPDFLILDEPTNHLDLPSIIWLEEYLKKFKGTLLFVSHDEDLLNRLPNVILHLKNQSLNEYHGNFNDFLEQYEVAQSTKTAQKENIQKRIKDVSQFVDRFKAKASKAAQARSRMKLISKLNEEAQSIQVDSEDKTFKIKIPVTEKSGKVTATLEDVSIGYDKPLFQKVNFLVERGAKIAIVGANGLGKSTLMKSILGIIPFLDGDFTLGHNVKPSYFAQDQLDHLKLDKSVFDNLLLANHKITTSYARSLLGSFLFKGDDVYKPVSVLSGGEKSRLGLACLLSQDSNFLLLDEPTNHLDMASCELLADALKSYEGTIMFISHNRKFINLAATHLLVLSSKRKVYLFNGNLEENEIESLL
jgi:ATP-binding cassette subfamily F protein 3